jgi:type II secretory pathway pseudopilin PulG
MSAEAHHALLVGRGLVAGGRGLGRALIWHPAIFAMVAWTLYGMLMSLHAVASATPDEVREVRAGQAVIITNTYSYSGLATTAHIAAQWALLFASIGTFGLVATAILSVFGSSHRRARRDSRVMAAGRHISAENRRARSDVAGARARLGKVGDRRARKWGKRWSREAAAGETYSEPGAVDRWLLRQTKPPKTRKARKADRAAKKIGKADKRRQTAELDAEWDIELAAPVEHQTLLDPTNGPPLSPVQRAEYAERREMSDRERLAADTAALFEGSTP